MPVRYSVQHDWRRLILSAAVTGVICGLGPQGYVLAMQAMAELLGQGM